MSRSLRGARWRSSLKLETRLQASPPSYAAVLQNPLYSTQSSFAPVSSRSDDRASGPPHALLETECVAQEELPFEEQPPVHLSAQACLEGLQRLRQLREECEALLAQPSGACLHAPPASFTRARLSPSHAVSATEAEAEEASALCSANAAKLPETPVPATREAAGPTSATSTLPGAQRTPLQSPHRAFVAWDSSPQVGSVRARDDGFNITVPCPPSLMPPERGDSEAALQRRRAQLQQKSQLILTMRRWSSSCRELMSHFTTHKPAVASGTAL